MFAELRNRKLRSANMRLYDAFYGGQVFSSLRYCQGWGAWIRTKIHRFKVWCAAVAPRPNALPVQWSRF